MKKQALVSGANGQDGSYLSELLLEKGYEVYGMIRRASTDTTGRLCESLANSNFHLIEGDVTDPWSVTDCVRMLEDNVEIYNLAAQSHVLTSFHQPQLTWDVVAGGCLNFLEAIRRFKPLARFYQASSSEMFGTSSDVDENGELYQNENTVFQPQSPYAIAKLAAHNAVGLYRRSYNLRGCSGILFNHDGPRRAESFVTQKISKYVALIRDQYAVHDIGNGKPVFDMSRTPKLQLGNIHASRDWGHAKDYVRAMWLMLQHKTPDDYVICTGETRTVKDFLNVAFAEIGVSDWTPFVEIDQSLFRPSEVPYLRGRNDKARNILGWQPTTSFSELVEEMVRLA